MSDTLSKKDVLSFLRSTGIMSIAANSSEYPISTVVLFAIDDDFTMYFTTHIGSKKAKAIEKDPRVSLSIWELNKLYVQAAGDVIQVTKREDIDAILDKLAQTSAQLEDFWPPILRLESDEYAVYRLNLVWMRVLDLSPDSMKAKTLPFQEIEI